MIYSPTEGITHYDGEFEAPFDKTVMHRFHGKTPDVTVTAYFDKQTGDGKWLMVEPTETSLGQYVASLPNGEQPATFQDSEFTIKGCVSYNDDPTQRVEIWRDY